MKRWWNIWIGGLIAIGLVSCKGELPLPVDEDPVFFVKMKLDGQAWNRSAGIDDWYMDATTDLDVEQIRVFAGAFQNFDVEKSESFQVTFRDWLNVGQSAPLGSEAFPIGKISYVSQVNPNDDNKSFEFRAVSQGKAPFTYEWDFGDGSTSTEANPVHVYNSDGKFHVNLTILDGRGCWSFARQEVRVGNDFKECRIGIDYKMVSDGSIALSAQLEEETVDPKTLIWSFGDGNTTENQFDVSHTYADPGIFELQLATQFDDKTCVIFKNIYPYSRLSCLSNFEYSPKRPGPELGRVILTYTNPEGKVYTSHTFKGQPSQSEFWLDEIEDYEPNQRGAPTKKLKVRFHGRLYSLEDEEDFMEVSEGEAIIAVEVP